VTLVAWGHKEHDVLYNYSLAKLHRYYEEIQEQKSIEYYGQALMLYNVLEGTKAPANVKPDYYKKQFKTLMDWLDRINPFSRKKHVDSKKNPLSNLLNHRTIVVPLVQEHIKKGSDTK